jgi:hypothetical protein
MEMVADTISTNMNAIERAFRRFRKISLLWHRKDQDDAVNQRIFSVLIGPKSIEYVVFGPNIPSVSDGIFTMPIEDFLDEFSPAIKN